MPSVGKHLNHSREASDVKQNQNKKKQTCGSGGKSEIRRKKLTKMRPWVDYQKVYQIPEDYQPPVGYEAMAASTQFPNLNSNEYRAKPVTYEKKVLPCIEILEKDTNNGYIVASNEISGRLWYGNIFGYKSFDDFRTGNIENSLFHIRTESTITQMKLLPGMRLLIAELNGNVQLYSLSNNMAPTSTSNKYCLFKIGECEHSANVFALDVMRANPSKVITGAADGTIKILDLSHDDIEVHTNRPYSHAENVSGISSAPTNEDLYVSCSHDRCILMWDERQPRPAMEIHANHDCNIRTIYWTAEDENKGLVMAGDAAGQILVFDVRKPKEILGKEQICDSWIHGFNFNKNRALIFTNSHRVDVFEVEGAKLKRIFQKETKGVTRSAAWTSHDAFNVVGWNDFIASYQLE